MNRKIFCLGLCTSLLALTFPAEAQQPAQIPRIGLLIATSPTTNPVRIEAFRQGLRELGYVEAKNVIFEYRYAEGKIALLPALLDELVRLKVDVIVAGGPSVTRAAKETTVTIPIVMTWDYDPVGNGFVASLARPGGNITGLATLAPEISGKQLELLKEIIPKLSRVVVLGTSNTPGNAEALRATELAAAALKVQLRYLEIRDRKDIETAFQAARKGRADAVLTLASRVLVSDRTQVAHLAVTSRLPVIYGESEHVEAGGLMTYGVSISELVPARRYICGQDSERRQACRSARGAAEEVRVHHQSESRKANRSHDSPECFGESG